MRPLVSVEEMKKCDRETMRVLGCDSFSLMKKVSDQMTEVLVSLYLPKPPSKILILTGPGNNGGDAFCLAQKLVEMSYSVFVYEVFASSSPDCLKAKSEFKGQMISELIESDFIIDGIFGLMGSAEINSGLSSLMRQVNSKNAFRIALDIPTGISAKASVSHPDSFCADLSLCVGFPKLCFLNPQVLQYCGAIEYIDPGFTRPSDSEYMAIERSDFLGAARTALSHKKAHLGVIAGSLQGPGAAFMAAEAGSRMGVGYSHLYFAKPESSLEISFSNASFLYSPVWEWKDLRAMDVVVAGCGGLPQGAEENLNQLALPQVLDADVFSEFSFSSLSLSPFRILTPHPGEAARVLNCSVEEILKDPFASARRLSQRTSAHIYLKTIPGILVFREDQSSLQLESLPNIIGPHMNYVNLSANASFATAGSGDVLAGILGGSLASWQTRPAQAVISALVFQWEIGNILRTTSASISSDQLQIFSQAFSRLNQGVGGD